MRAVIAEFFGTLVVMMFGSGVVAMTVLFGKGLPAEIVNGGYTNITIAWGIAVTMGIYVSSKWSGAHLNPAVTVSLALFRKFPWRMVGPYILAQVAAAFCAAALVFWNYRPAFHLFDPGLTKTAGIFTTFPAFPNQLSAGLLDQVLGTALLMFMILAIGEHATDMGPILVGLLVIVIGMSFGGMHGYAINPARDFGPRLFTAVAGFQNNGLTSGPPVFWVPIVGPLLGGVAGSAAFEWSLGSKSGWLKSN